MSSNLSKRNRATVINTGVTRGSNYEALVRTEQSFFSQKNGFPRDAAELGQELSAKANKLNQLKLKGKKFPKIEQCLSHEIENLIQQLEAMNCRVERGEKGQYTVYAPPKIFLSIEPTRGPS